ncbi:acyltransferase [Congregibacter brevis]|uniref:Acyltransferase n=1 Tax=Congregibacter brevis TaxID=3081201 RepID=A0ABZ0IFJ7_9GAMM|nr:acyltransferase [Congregibacter sp. IMCC45268]
MVETKPDASNMPEKLIIKSSLKKLARGGAVLVVAPLIICDALARTLHPEGTFSGTSQLLSLFPGKAGSYLRVAFYRFAMQSCAADCFIGFGTVFSQRNTTIGRAVYIGPQCNIGACSIGEDSLIASGVHIMSGSDQHHFDSVDVPIQEQGGEYAAVNVGVDCWIGNGALVMASVEDKTIVGAGAVVSRSLPPLSIAVGNPARIVKSRIQSPVCDSSPNNRT